MKAIKKNYTIDDLYASAWQSAIENVGTLLNIDFCEWARIENLCRALGVIFDDNGNIVR